ncbi:MAG TPA: biotin/lipoyl-containing protein, partial [Cellvibrio sp.]
MAIQTIKVPDIGGAEGVEVIEISVKVGDVIAEGDSIVVLETDKASMEIPADKTGKVVAIKVNLGDKVSQDSVLLEVEAEGASEAAPAPQAAAPVAAAAPAPAPAAAASAEVQAVVPDIGGAEGVEVIEISVKVGDEVAAGDSLIVLETDKASMEIPAEAAGTIVSIAVNVGDKVSQGAVIGVLATTGSAASAPAAAPAKAEPAPVAAAAPAPKAEAVKPAAAPVADVEQTGDVYAGPAVRKLARQLGVDMGKVSGTGPRGRLLKDDVRAYVKPIVQAAQSGASLGGGSGIPALPVIDYAKFGEIEIIKMSKIKKLTAEAMTRSWLNVPRITQFDDADITDLEAFRNSMKAEAEKRGSKLTPLPFIVKAVAAALVAEPSFNVSMHQDGESIVH